MATRLCIDHTLAHFVEVVLVY